MRVAIAAGLLSLAACGHADGDTTTPSGDPQKTPALPSPDPDPDPEPCAITALASGASHACALRSDGGVTCWGDFLTVGFCAPSGTGAPATVEAIADARSLSSQTSHTCVVTESKTVRCWGWNQYAQLGSASNVHWVVVPADVVDEQGAVFGDVDQVAAGGGHSCARRAGRLWCWGKDAEHPVEVPGLDEVIDVRAGNSHTCALRADGSLWCWGWNGLGQVGNGTQADVTAPAHVLDDVTAVAAGIQHTCAIDGGGRVLCWGDNGSGQLGDGTTTLRTTPVEVSSALSARALAVGDHHTCAVDTQGGLWCWGANWVGQLGLGAADDDGVAVPVRASAIDAPIAAVAAGEAHTCALAESGELSCWGSNDEGEVGTGERSLGGVLHPSAVSVCPPVAPSPVAECAWIPYPEPEPEPPLPSWPATASVLSSGHLTPIAIAVDDGDVYFASFGGIAPEPAGHISKVAKHGGSTLVIAAQRRRPVSLALDADQVLWAEQGETDADGSVRAAPKLGGESTLVAATGQRPIAIALHGGSVHFLTHDLAGTLGRAPATGGATTVLVSDLPMAFGLGVDASGLYFTVGDASRSVIRTDLDGTNASVLASGAPNPGPVALSASDVFWTTIDALSSTVNRVGKPGDSAATIVESSGKKTALAVDGSHVWWGSGSELWRASLAGASPTLVLSAPQPIRAIAVDDSAVYIASGTVDGTIAKLPK
jgi:alpha-tubulin suppressor-like RCC1 family protein